MAATDLQPPNSDVETISPQQFQESARFDANAGVGKAASLALLGSATGDLEAQRCIRDEWSGNLRKPEYQGPDSDLADAGGLLISRLCAAHGDQSDASVLAMVLLTVGDRFHNHGRHGIGWECIAESLSLFGRLADEGDAEAAEIVKGLLDELPADAVARAKEYTLKGKIDGTPGAPTCLRAYH